MTCIVTMYGDKLEENVACRKKVFYFRPKKKTTKKISGRRDLSFRCSYHVAGMSRSAALKRVKLLSVDHKDIFGIESCWFCVCRYNCAGDRARAGSSRRPGFFLQVLKAGTSSIIQLMLPCRIFSLNISSVEIRTVIMKNQKKNRSITIATCFHFF